MYKEDFLKSTALLITASVLGKYTPWDFNELNYYVTNLIGSTSHGHRERKSAYESMDADIFRQFRCFLFVEKNYASRVVGKSLIFKIHSLLIDCDINSVSYRKSDFIEDFGRSILVSPGEISYEIQKLGEEINFHDFSRNPVDPEKKLAWLFSEIIRIHPFEDGNGRTARCLTLFLAKKWGYDYFIIPKYRNDKEWKKALDEALNGNLSDMEGFFRDRLVVGDR